MVYGDIVLGAWWLQAITWTNFDLSSVKSSDIHLKAVSQEIPQPSLKYTVKLLIQNFI